MGTKLGKQNPQTATNLQTTANPQPIGESKSVWITSLICGLVVFIAFVLAVLSTTNPPTVQIIVSVPDSFMDGFVMQKSLTVGGSAEIAGSTNVTNTHTGLSVDTKALVVTGDLTVGSQTITPANIVAFAVPNTFLQLELAHPVVLTIPVHASTSLFLGLSAFSQAFFAVTTGSNASLYDFKLNNTAIALAHLAPGSYNISLNMNGPAASQAVATKLVPILVAYDDSIQEWKSFAPGLLSSIGFMQSQIGLKYIWNVTFGFITTGALTVLPAFTNATRIGFQVYVQYGVGQALPVTWNITEMSFSIVKVL